jgi:long-chain fatty acid transport protein
VNTSGSTKRIVGAALAAGVSLCAGQACAAAFQLAEQNGSGLGNAYAGQAAAAEDASTIFFNPAGMAYIKVRQIVGGFNAIGPKAEFNDGGSQPPGAGLLGHAHGGDGGDAGDLSFVPHAYLSWEVMPDQLWLGIGVGAPFGLKTEYDSDWVGRFHAVKSEVETININPSVAWKVNEAVSLGAGVTFQRLKADLTSQLSYRAVALGSGIVPIIAGTPSGSEGRVAIDGDDWGVGWNAGLMLNLGPATRLGVSYRSTIKYDLEGDAKFSGRPAALNAVPAVANGKINADLKLPDTLSIALAHQLTPRTQLLLDYTWTGWDSVQSLDINRSDGTKLAGLPLHLENSWRAGAGLNYQLDDAWKLRFGLALDKTPVRDAYRSPRLPDEDRVWAAIGAQWQFSKAGALDLGYAYIWADDASVDQASQNPAASQLPRGHLVGDYDASVQLFALQLRYSF